MTAQELLNTNGIYLKNYDLGNHTSICPKCSHDRKKKKTECLSVRIDDKGACWNCHHCGWSGPEKGQHSAPETPSTSAKTDDKNFVATYDYPGFQKVRYPKGHEPRFRIRHRDPSSNRAGKGWDWGAGGADTSALYRKDEIDEQIALGRTILLVEGEKDVDRLWAISIPATCNALGAAQNDKPKWKAEHSEQLRGADIIVIPDHDEAGYAHADATCQLSLGIAKRVRILKLAEHWPDIPKGGDVSDYLDAGHTREQLDALIEQAPDYGQPASGLGEWDAGDEPGTIPPRQWLLGNQFCRSFISSIVAAGGAGKSALRLLQFISMAIGRSLCGQHVFRRCRVLLISLEDDRDELQRRIKAVLDHYEIERKELKGWLFCASPKLAKLAEMKNHTRTIGPLEQYIREAIKRRNPDIVGLDPFIKTHSLEENDSGDMDFVCDLLARFAIEFNIAVDSPHHVHKGQVTPGDVDSGRGSSGIRDAGRLVYTLAPMSESEAKIFNIKAENRRVYVRLDSAKVNIAAPSAKAEWFHIVGQPIGNGTDEYPNGDTIQVVEPWAPPDAWRDTTSIGLNAILTDINLGMTSEDGKPTGQRYSNAPKTDRAVWPVVQKHYPDKSEAECRTIIHAWLATGLLYPEDYDDPVERKKRKGLKVDNSKRPS
jgi:hypothetical protein